MKKFLVAGLLVLPLLLFPQIEAGKMNAGIAGSIGLKPMFYMNLGGHFGKMFTDNLEFGFSASFDHHGGTTSFSAGVLAYYHMKLAEGIYGFAGLEVLFPIKPSFSNRQNINMGIDYFIGENVAIRIYNMFTVQEFDFGNFADAIIIGTVAYF